MTPTLDLAALPESYVRSLDMIRDAPAGRPFVVAQLGQSLDGRIALPSGESRWINNEAALDHVHRLRALVDAVVVGVGTAIADDPQLNVRRVAGRNPARVVIDPNGRLPGNARLFCNDGAACVIVTRPGTETNPEATAVLVEPNRDGKLAPEHIVAALHAKGFSRLLIEGGATTVSSFLDAGVVDRLHVLVAPCILGSGKTGLDLAPLGRLADARRPRALVHVLEGGDVLFDCDMRS